MSLALFERDSSDRSIFQPTEYTRGPWSPDAEHGGAPTALLATILEQIDTADAPRICDDAGTAMFVARLTFELLRPVPLTPLRVKTRVQRRGRKVQLVGASLFSGDVEVASATALRMRCTELPVPAEARPQPTPPAGPNSGFTSEPPWEKPPDAIGYHTHAVSHRFVAGTFAEAGPSTDWIGLKADVIAGETTHPLARVPAAADFGNGISWTLSRAEGWVFINPDLTVYLHRYPTTNWVALAAETWAQSHGVGLAESQLWDEQGVIGRSVQSLLLDKLK